MQGPGSNSQSNTASSKRQPLTCTHARDRLNGEGGGFGSFDFTSVTYPDPSLTSSPTRANSAAPAPYNSATRTPVSRPLEYGPPAASTSSVHDQPARPAHEPQARPQYESAVAVAPPRGDLEAILSEKDAVIERIRADSSKRRDELYDTKSKLAVAEEKIRAHEANMRMYEKHAEEDKATFEALTSRVRAREEELVDRAEKMRKEALEEAEKCVNAMFKSREDDLDRLEKRSKEQFDALALSMGACSDMAKTHAQEVESLRASHAQDVSALNSAHAEAMSGAKHDLEQAAAEHERQIAEVRGLLAEAKADAESKLAQANAQAAFTLAEAKGDAAAKLAEANAQAAAKLAEANAQAASALAEAKGEAKGEVERVTSELTLQALKDIEALRAAKDGTIAGLKDDLAEVKIAHAVCESQLACLKASSVTERNYCVAVAKLNTGFKDKTAVERITRQCQEAVAQVASEYMEDDEARTAAEDPHAEEAESKSGGNLSEPGQADGAANLADGAAAKTN